MSEIKTIYLKNTKNGLLFNLAVEDRFLYNEVIFIEATAGEVKDWLAGTYWEKYNLLVPLSSSQDDLAENNTILPIVPVADPVKTEELNPPAENTSVLPADLAVKTKAELLDIIKTIDPKTTLNDRDVKADIIEAIEVSQSVSEPQESVA